MSKKIYIDKEQWDYIVNYLTKNVPTSNKEAFLKAVNPTEIDTDQSIEERAKNYAEHLGGGIYSKNDIYLYTQGATEQDLISKAREKEFAEWCSINGWFFYKKDNLWRKHGNGGFEYKTTEELFNQFTNR